ncbi:MAG: YraN family protein [Saprospiraceae bacterium]
MAKQQIIGNLGEDTACTYLQNAGYEILERNWRFQKAEVDIIALLGQTLIFVEVKAKTYIKFGAPEESVSLRKENMLVDAAVQYMSSLNHEQEIRFDIISIVFDTKMQPTISHFKDAFFPGI